MNRPNLVKFLEALGSKIKGGDSWVVSSCVFAPWRHTNGTDNTPSFGGKVKNNGESFFHCFTCQNKGTAYDLVLKIKALSKKTGHNCDLKTAMQLAMVEEEDEVEDFATYEEEMEKKSKVFHEFSTWWLESFPVGYQHPYLKERGIPEKVAKELGVRFDFAKQRICFPYYDFNGRLAGMYGRAVDLTNPVRYYSYDFYGDHNPVVWMGENHVDLDEPVILTEGSFDYAKIYQGNQNVAAGLTTSIPDIKFKRLRDATKIVTFFDFGTGGNVARGKVDKYFKNICSVEHILLTEEEGDAGNLDVTLIAKLLGEVL